MRVMNKALKVAYLDYTSVCVMGQTLTQIESSLNNAASEKCFILMEPPSVYQSSIGLLIT